MQLNTMHFTFLVISFVFFSTRHLYNTKLGVLLLLNADLQLSGANVLLHMWPSMVLEALSKHASHVLSLILDSL